MAATPPVVDVCKLHENHPDIVASDWRSPLICKMLGSKQYADGSKEIQDTYSGQDGAEVKRTLLLKWEGINDEFKQRINTYQAPVLSEHAACGLACILLSERTNKKITEVTQRGDRADYWLGNREMMLEVSGHQTGPLEALNEEKKKQLLDNPHEADGYVCAAIFSECEASLRFYSFNGEV